MSFTFSGESAKDLYYGGKKIAKAYKGDTLVHVAYDPSDITPGLLDMNMTEYVLPPKVTEIKRFIGSARGVYWGAGSKQITVYTKHPDVLGLREGATTTLAQDLQCVGKLGLVGFNLGQVGGVPLEQSRTGLVSRRLRRLTDLNTAHMKQTRQQRIPVLGKRNKPDPFHFYNGH